MSIEVTMCLTFLQIVEDERAMAKSEGPSTFRATEIGGGVRCVVLQDSSHTGPEQEQYDSYKSELWRPPASEQAANWRENGKDCPVPECKR